MRIVVTTGLIAFVLSSLSIGNETQSQSKSKSNQEAKRPNILFIFTDDHAPHAIGAYEGWLKDVNPTPNIDKLASQGMLFQNSFCTNSICGPSRAVILTGKHSHMNGFMNNGNQFDGDQQTFPKLLRKAGYTTAMIGKWHLKSEPQGFDYWDILPGQGQYYNPQLISKDGRRRVEGYCTDVVTDLAIDWLKQNQDGDQPFMLMCQHKAPHRCWMPAERHLNLYDDTEMPVPETLFDSFDDNASSVKIHEMGIDKHMDIYYDLFVDYDKYPDPPHPVDRSGRRNMEVMTVDQLANWHAAYGPKNEAFKRANLTGKDLVRWKYQRYVKNYLRCIKGVDESVGRLMDYLEKSGQADNTIVIYSSDQGFYLGDHGWFDKRWMYDESMKMPLIVKWPGVTKPGSVDDHLVQNLDYAETFLEMAGAKIPDDMQGKSLVPILKGESPEQWRESMYYHYYEFPSVHMVTRHFGVRTKKFKLMRLYQFDQWEFYDLEKDPDELTNEYNNPAYADKIAELKSELNTLRSVYQDDSEAFTLPADVQQGYFEGTHRQR